MAPNCDIEYQSLRQEILDRFNREFNTVSLGLTATVAIAGYGLSQVDKNPYLFLTPVVILAATCLQLVQSHYSILRIATYIRVRIEAQPDEPKKWETCLSKLREKESAARKFLPETSFSIMLHVMIATAVGTLSILLAGGYGWSNYQAGGFQCHHLVALVVSIVMLLFWAWFSYRVFRKLNTKTLLKYEDEFAKDLIA